MLINNTVEPQNKTSKKIHVPIAAQVTRKSPYNIEVTGGWSMKTHPKKCACEFDLFLFSLIYLFITCLAMFVTMQLHHLETERLNDLGNRNQMLINRTMILITENQLILQNLVKCCCNNNSKEILGENLNTEFLDVQPTDSYYGYEPRLSRHKRSDNDANVQSRDKKKNKRNRTKTIETVAVQFKGYLPEGYAKLPSEGVLGPWSESSNNDNHLELMGVKLIEQKCKLEISRSGLYFIYSQVTYRSKNTSNVYSINIISATDKSNRPITTCSSEGSAVNDGEVSCFTSSIRPLVPGDVVYLQQAQPDVEINYYDSYTFIGIIHLKSL